MLFFVSTLGFAQAVSAVPVGARAVTVMVCDRVDGCARAFRAMADHCSAQGIPLLDFDDVAAAGPAGGNARLIFEEASREAEIHPDRHHLESARKALAKTPLTLPPDEVFSLWLRLADARLTGGDLASAAEAFAAADSTSAHRVYDLPPLTPAALEMYVALAGKRAENGVVRVHANQPGARVTIDGKPAAENDNVVVSGWHRISVERAGRRTAWVGEVVVPPGALLQVEADLSADDAPAALEAAVNGAIRGESPPIDVGERLAAWGRREGLTQVRFVSVVAVENDYPTPEERISGTDGNWAVHATWLDVSRARFDPHGSGPNSLRTAAAADRFSLGLALGYSRLQQTVASGPDPHDHIDAELVGVMRVLPTLAVDARVGIWHAAQPYYLYSEWADRNVIPVAAGGRWTPLGGAGAYAGAHVLAVVPFAFGGELFGGWEWHPSPRWRLGVEGKAGVTDRGPLVGAGVTMGFAG